MWTVWRLNQGRRQLVGTYLTQGSALSALDLLPAWVLSKEGEKIRLASWCVQER